MMPRSSGARPKKAVQEEVAELRVKLGECRGHEWQRAHAIFQEICRLCEHKGSKGGIGAPYPRACKFCDRYGHSTQFCKVKKAHDLEEEQREIQKIMDEETAWKARHVGTTLPRYWLARMEWLQERYDAACAAGLEGCTEEWDFGGTCEVHGLPLGKRCAGCEEWNAFMKIRDAQVPWTGDDLPKT